MALSGKRGPRRPNSHSIPQLISYGFFCLYQFHICSSSLTASRTSQASDISFCGRMTCFSRLCCAIVGGCVACGPIMSRSFAVVRAAVESRPVGVAAPRWDRSGMHRASVAVTSDTSCGQYTQSAVLEQMQRTWNEDGSCAARDVEIGLSRPLSSACRRPVHL